VSDLSILIQAVNAGDAAAAEAIVPLVYDELRAIAAAHLRRVGNHGTLQPTALVHEAYLRLLGRDASFANSRHFFFAAARAMRDVLVERARRGGHRRVRELAQSIDVEIADSRELGPDAADSMLALDAALPRLQSTDARAHDVVMLRFFAGLAPEQIAEALGITRRTVERDWRFARSWLFDALHGESGDSPGASNG